MRILGTSTVLLAAVLVAAAATPASAKVYNVVFAGKVVPVDCPESPEGHTLSWVSQTCTAVLVAPAGTQTLGTTRSGTVAGGSK